MLFRSLVLAFSIIFALSERFIYIEYGDSRIGLFDFTIIAYVLGALFVSFKLPKKMIFLLFILIISQIFIFLFINSNISYSAPITICFKILFVYLISRHGLSDFYLKSIGIFSFIVLTSGLLLLSDGTPFYEVEVLNRNETLSYMLAAVFFIPENRIKLRTLLASALLFLSFIVGSRQIAISFILALFILLFFKSKYNFLYKIAIIFIVILIFNFGFQYYLTTIDDYNFRRYNFFSYINDYEQLLDITTNKDITQGDKYRILNIISGIQGWVNSPLLGNGLGSYIRLNEFGKVAHNTYITLLFEGGILLLGLFFYIIKSFIPTKFSFFTLLIFVTMLINLNFIEAIGKYTIYLFFIWLMIYRYNHKIRSSISTNAV
jgi:hypothetical protein